MARPYQHPSYFDAYQEFIPNYEQFKLSQATLPPVIIRRNRLKCNLEEFEKFLSRRVEDGAIQNFKVFPFVEDCYEIETDKPIIGGVWEHHIGLYYMQGASSVLPVMALAPRPGEKILDMCAAPGGKTGLIAEAMMDQGLLVANEPSHGRRRVLKANLDRMGATNIAITSYYGEEFPGQELFDRILLDGPCSAEGSLRGGWSKAFDYERNETYRHGLRRAQAKLLKRAYELLKPGGTLVYSTCTYDPQENEVQVDEVLKTHPNLDIIDTQFPGPWVDGISSWQGKIFDERVKMSKHVFPHRFNSWGFFFATFIKR